MFHPRHLIEQSWSTEIIIGANERWSVVPNCAKPYQPCPGPGLSGSQNPSTLIRDLQKRRALLHEMVGQHSLSFLRVEPVGAPPPLARSSEESGHKPRLACHRVPVVGIAKQHSFFNGQTARKDPGVAHRARERRQPRGVYQR